MNYPPRINPDMDLSAFKDGLEEIIPEKIESLLKRMEELIAQRKHNYEVISRFSRRGEIDKSGVYFWSLWNELEHGEYAVCQKWLQYWLSLLSQITKTEQVSITAERSKEFKDEWERRLEVQRARSVPVENFYQGQLRGSGSRLSGKCPFHEEKTASFYIYTNANNWHCFGCSENGDVIDFVMKLKGFTFPEAIKFLL